MKHSYKPLPTFNVQMATATIIVFPPHRRIGRIRDVAFKASRKSTSKAYQAYLCQVDHGFRSELSKYGLGNSRQTKLLEQFWDAVGIQTDSLTETVHHHEGHN